MKLVGLEHLDPQTVYDRKKICTVHFSDNCRIPGKKRLNSNSYPTLHISTGNILCILFLRVFHNSYYW